MEEIHIQTFGLYTHLSNKAKHLFPMLYLFPSYYFLNVLLGPKTHHIQNYKHIIHKSYI